VERRVTERLLIVLALLALVVVVALVVRARSRRRAAALVGAAVPDELRARFASDAPRVVYFYGPHCATCARQSAALDELAAEHEVVRVDATRETAVADALHVATVPATAVVDAAGRVRALNLGYQPRETLAEQLAQAS
jgi:thioredoxin-like negative regulator of GroEL